MNRVTGKRCCGRSKSQSGQSASFSSDIHMLDRQWLTCFVERGVLLSHVRCYGEIFWVATYRKRAFWLGSVGWSSSSKGVGKNMSVCLLGVFLRRRIGAAQICLMEPRTRSRMTPRRNLTAARQLSMSRRYFCTIAKVEICFLYIFLFRPQPIVVDA